MTEARPYPGPSHPNLFRVIYRSRSTTPDIPGLQTIAEILGEARTNNARRGLTGMLLAHDGWYLQVLEGSKVQIDALMDALHRDVRHTHIDVLSLAQIDAALFGRWTMGETQITPTLQLRLKYHPLDTIDADTALALLHSEAGA